MRQHALHERRVARVVSGFLRQQAQRLAAAVKAAGLLTAELVPHLMDVDREHRAFMLTLRRPLAAVFYSEAAAEYRRAPKRKPQKSTAGDIRRAMREMPDESLEALRGQLDELQSQGFWKSIQSTTKERLSRVLLEGIGAGQSNAELGKAIVKAMGGSAASARGLSIARTEVTGLMNAAHHGVQKYLAESGVNSLTVWSTTMDNHARGTHRLLNGVTVKAGTNFDVGGFPAPYPGHWSLPARERCNCRCVTVSKIAFDQGLGLSEEDQEDIALTMAGLGLTP
jgi:hypothetical protein